MAEISIPSADYERHVLGWAAEALEEGEAYLKSQDGYNKVGECMRTIMGDRRDAEAILGSGKLSSTSSNRFAKVAADMAALMTDIKPFWEFRTGNKRFEKNASIFGKLSSIWYQQRQIDMRFSDCVKYALAGATSYAHQFWNPETEDLDMLAEDPRDVFPIRPIGTQSLQDAFGCIVREERTVNYLRQQFPEKAHLIKADRDGSISALRLENTRAGKLLEAIGSPFRAALFGSKTAHDIPKIPTADLFTIYVKDPSRNETGAVRRVGDFSPDGKPLNNWSYEVEPDGLIYPRKRCIIATRTAVLYDGPSIYWHGLFPYTKLTLDPWPWTWLGKGLLWDLLPLQQSLDKNLRNVDDHTAKATEPDVIADKNSVSKAALEKMNTRRAGGKYQHNPIAGKGMQLVYPGPLDPSISKTIEFIINEMQELSGVRDMSQMMRLNQLPSGDTIDKMVEAMTPSSRARSRVIEAFMREFAMIAAYNFAQFYTPLMRLTMLGPSGIIQEDFDRDIGTMIPDFVHESDFNQWGHPTTEALARGPLPRYDRAREFLRQFSYHIAPGSLLSSSEIERKLLYLQLARAGWIDLWTALEVLGIPNVGEPPAGADTIMQRLQAQQQMGLGMEASAAGRKASGQSMPRMKISESG